MNTEEIETAKQEIEDMIEEAIDNEKMEDNFGSLETPKTSWSSLTEAMEQMKRNYLDSTRIVVKSELKLKKDHGFYSESDIQTFYDFLFDDLLDTAQRLSRENPKSDNILDFFEEVNNKYPEFGKFDVDILCQLTVIMRLYGMDKFGKAQKQLLITILEETCNLYGLF